eukprot:1549261-Amphidinium_carterae.1
MAPCPLHWAKIWMMRATQWSAPPIPPSCKTDRHQVKEYLLNSKPPFFRGTRSAGYPAKAWPSSAGHSTRA